MHIFNEWRILLYYPLGAAPPIFFALRFLIQWIKSEKAGISYVDETFWRLSIIGNILSFLHFSIQGQYPFALIQAGNALIAWRNLNLMGAKPPYSFAKTLSIFFLFISLVVVCFGSIEWISGSAQWIHTPAQSFFTQPQSSLFLWHLLGLTGQGLFASRFWIQWWNAERDKRTSLGRIFWVLSLVGSLLSAVYFVHIRDVVSSINQLFGIVPYLRNLMLLAPKKTRAKKM